MGGLTEVAGQQVAVLDLLVFVWFVLVIPSVAYVAYDAFTKNPEMTVMKWGWVLVTLYTGPVGLALYVLSCKEPAPGTHEDFVRPLWKQALGSTIHCLAGDATGVIIAATITALIGLPMGIDFITEYFFGFLFGLLIFQALFMRDMLGGSYAKAVKSSFMPEWLSMNMVMAGMIPTMAVLMMGADMRAMWPGEPLYWGVMSLAVIVGGVLAYPVNVWLVAKGLKHGMGTVRALGEGGHSLSAEQGRPAAHATHGAGHAVAPAEGS